MEDILKLIPGSNGITQGALDLAQRVYDLQSKDPNIDKIRFAKHSINGYSGMPFLVANVELKRPFADLDQFKSYLQKHNLPSRELFDEENNPRFGFAENAYSSDAFYADFYQPQRLK